MSYEWKWSTTDKPPAEADKMLKEAEKRLSMAKAEYNNARDKLLSAYKKENVKTTTNNLWMFVVLFVIQLVITLANLYLYFSK